MIVGFLDLLGFSPLLDLSAEVAMDNVFSFNHAIKTRVIDRMAYPDNENLQKFVEKSMATSFEYLISFSDSLILGSNNVELFVEQLCNFVSLLYIEYSEPFRKPFSDVFDVDSNKISSYENGGDKKA